MVWLPKAADGRWVKWVKGVRMYPLPAISPRDVMYSVGTVVNNTVLPISKLLREYLLKVLIARKKSVTSR